eukprot:CAMPEP_0201675708 /NCGR_PEP_ID=MMETSP0494-20130426/40135_1 /ASSEMBLY_ACC=CAM_ASM_000839 /TAXON_ID=420259 /ORGANISM="Thalassiosira gravida, Strain GMp14c1" /LENGTH=151 /DNA_ID=CAMNT_0048158227 /DNA_START=113 /DNA_END=564 /DNA_ORIENTATION=-
MRMHTPGNLMKKSTKRWKASPPPGKHDIPLQQCRPRTCIQQAREPALELELFEPSPVPLRYQEFNLSPFATPKFPSQYPRKRLFDAYRAEPGQNDPKQIQAKTKRPFTTLCLFSFMVVVVASMHLVNFGNDSFEGIISKRNGKITSVTDKA